VFIADNGVITRETFSEVNAKANQVANFFRKENIKPGNVVSLMMDNRSELIYCFLAAAKIGCILALINTNLKSKPLIHCLVASQARLFIIGN